MRTDSEKLFETYLKDNGLTDFEYEPDLEGTTRRPDYRIRVSDMEVFCEVKEFASGLPINEVGCFDPYPAIREKINMAQKQLHALKGRMCVIVLANPHNALVDLGPMFIYGSMLGNIGITIPFDPDTETLDAGRAIQAFLAGGKMIKYRDGRPIAHQNTTISAICVLDAVAEGSRRLGIRIAKWKRETGCSPTVESILKMAVEAQGTEADGSLYHLRMQVYENPYTVAPLVERFGTGPWDERFGDNNRRLCRRFVGPSLAALEAEEFAAGVDRTDALGLRRD